MTGPGPNVVLLMNMGGPDSEAARRAVPDQLFLDPEILPLPLPGFLRSLVARRIAAKRAPKVIPRYRLLGEIARGGTGIVLRGHDVDLGRDVALKILRDEYPEAPDVLQRFVEEAQIGGQLQHPGIVPVYELGLLPDCKPFFTMKLVKGRTFAGER